MSQVTQLTVSTQSTANVKMLINFKWRLRDMGISYNTKAVTDGLVLCLDAANPKSYSPNVHPFPTDLFSWVTSATRATLSRDTTTQSPVGNTPLRMVTSGLTDPYLNSYAAPQWNLAIAAPGEVWTVSVWAKANVPTQGQIFIFSSISTTGSFNTAPAGNMNITTSWQRFSFTATLSGATTDRIQTRLDGPDSGVGTDGVTAPIIWFDGLQVEKSAAPTTFNSRTNTNGTSWYDLSGNIRNFTIFGSPFYNPLGYFTFANNQTTQYMMRFPFETPTADITYSCWFRSNFIQPNQTPFTYSVNGDNEMLFFTNSSTQFAPHPKGAAIGVNTTNMTNIWVNFAWSRQTSTGENLFYRDGQLIGQYTASAGVSTVANGHLIIGQEADSAGGGFDPNQNLDGDFSRFDVYDRILNAQEIQQNFNALRGRYGI